MKFSQTPLAGAYVVDIDRNEDERGFFGRVFCQDEFRALGLFTEIAQSNVSWNSCRGTLRGLHYQLAPHAEAKIVRCTRGTVWDVIVDLRDSSPTRLRWHAVELSAENRLSLYVPEGFAHGFQTLTDDVELLYQMSAFYHAESARGLRWNDPVVGIEWPLPDAIMSERDRTYPFLA